MNPVTKVFCGPLGLNGFFDGLLGGCRSSFLAPMSTLDRCGMVAAAATRIKPQSRGAMLDNRLMLSAEKEGIAVGVGIVRYHRTW